MSMDLPPPPPGSAAPPLLPRGCGPASIRTHLADGRPVCLRMVEPADEARLREGIARLSPRSRYLRFFSGAAVPPDRVIERLVDVDGVLHVAWGALDTSLPGEPAIGVVHAIRPDAGDHAAEFSIAVIDKYHGLGLGRLLVATLLLDLCGDAGAPEVLDAVVLTENRAAIDFMLRLGAERAELDGTTAEYRIDVARAVELLRGESDPAGLADVFAFFDEVRRPGTPPAP